ncbi:hypothetical protein PG995_006047 [Apiospora arundinis]
MGPWNRRAGPKAPRISSPTTIAIDLLVAAGAVNDDAGEDLDNCLRADERQHQDTAAEGRGLQDTLQEEREVVLDTDKDHAVREGDEERRVVRPVPEDGQRDDGVLGQALLAKQEEADHEPAEDDEADDLGAVPGEDGPAEVEPEQEHERHGEDGEGADPVDGLDARASGNEHYHAVTQRRE